MDSDGSAVATVRRLETRPEESLSLEACQALKILPLNVSSLFVDERNETEETDSGTEDQKSRRKICAENLLRDQEFPDSESAVKHAFLRLLPWKQIRHEHSSETSTAVEQSPDLAVEEHSGKRVTRSTAAAISATRKSSSDMVGRSLETARKSSDTEESNGAEEAEKRKNEFWPMVEKRNKKAPNDSVSRQINRLLFKLNKKFGTFSHFLQILIKKLFANFRKNFGA